MSYVYLYGFTLLRIPDVVWVAFTQTHAALHLLQHGALRLDSRQSSNLCPVSALCNAG